jgi:hypothetical protein
MTTNEALQILFDDSNTYYDFCDDADKRRALVWARAWNHITDKLGVVFDEDTEQWVTADEGNPV